MKFTKKALTGSIAAAVLATSGLMISSQAAAEAEVSGSVAVASTYLWRGFELGSGTPAVSGSLDVSAGGLYAGIWGSSGDQSAGTEYDVYVGYGGEVGDFSYDLMLISYVYPTGQYFNTDGQIGDFMEVIATVGYGPISFSYYDNVAGETGGYAGDEDYTYMSLSAELGSFSILYGVHDKGAFDAEHIDLSYAYNDNLSFTISTIVDSDLTDEPEPTFVVAYSLPISE